MARGLVTKNWLAISKVMLCMLFMCTANAANNLDDNAVELSASAYIPPYVFKDGHHGIEIDIIKHALEKAQLGPLTLHFLSNRRAEAQLRQGKISGAINIPKESGLEGYYSEPLLYFENVAISLAEHNFSIELFSDLHGKSILAFQNAKNYLGPDYAKAITKALSYDEVVNQYAQIDHLMKGWVDVIVLEKRIFQYYLHTFAMNQGRQTKPVTIHALWPPSPRHVVFTDSQLRERFNQGLAELKKTPRYKALLASAPSYAQRQSSK